jgi:hypothetical protein
MKISSKTNESELLKNTMERERKLLENKINELETQVKHLRQDKEKVKKES